MTSQSICGVFLMKLNEGDEMQKANQKRVAISISVVSSRFPDIIGFKSYQIMQP